MVGLGNFGIGRLRPEEGGDSHGGHQNPFQADLQDDITGD